MREDSERCVRIVGVVVEETYCFGGVGRLGRGYVIFELVEIVELELEYFLSTYGWGWLRFWFSGYFSCYFLRWVFYYY